jgi:hypothetical protein
MIDDILAAFVSVPGNLGDFLVRLFGADGPVRLSDVRNDGKMLSLTMSMSVETRGPPHSTGFRGGTDT